MSQLSYRSKGLLLTCVESRPGTVQNRVVVVGFSWGGWKSFAFATHRRDLSRVFVFYGTGPADVTTISAPVYGFYAGNDGGVGVTVPATTDAMRAAGKFYDPLRTKAPITDSCVSAKSMAIAIPQTKPRAIKPSTALSGSLRK